MIVKAFVVLDPERTRDVPAAELQDFVKQAIAPYKRPRAVAFVDELPRASTGKLQRYKLR
jgi:2-aminobenzoate-CoA ligase